MVEKSVVRDGELTNVGDNYARRVREQRFRSALLAIGEICAEAKKGELPQSASELAVQIERVLRTALKGV